MSSSSDALAQRLLDQVLICRRPCVSWPTSKAQQSTSGTIASLTLSNHTTQIWASLLSTAGQALPQSLHLLQLESSGKKQKMEDELVQKLMASGWHDQVKARCMEAIESKGHTNVTVDELVRAVAPAGRASVPNALKQEMLASMREFVDELNL